MKSILFRIFTTFTIAIVITACGGKTASSGQPPVEPTPSKSSIAISTDKVKLPQGVFVNTGDGYGLTYCNLQGQSVSVFKTPGLTNPRPGEVVIAGSVPPGPIQVPIVYLAQNPDPGLKVNINDQISPLILYRNMYKIAGAPGLPLIALSRVDDQDNGRTYKLFVGTLENIASTPPVVSLFSEKILFVYDPLVVEADGNTIKGVWYTELRGGLAEMDLSAIMDYIFMTIPLVKSKSIWMPIKISRVFPSIILWHSFWIRAFQKNLSLM
jgi:hypothetical protein